MKKIHYIYLNNKRMRILIIISFLCSFSAFSFSQNSVGTPEQIKSFFKTKTLVVFDENPFSEANVQLKNAVDKNWKLTEFEFIDVELAIIPGIEKLVISAPNTVIDSLAVICHFVILVWSCAVTV